MKIVSWRTVCATAAAVALIPAGAEEFHVATTADLVSRVQEARPGDVIFLSENVYDLTDVQVSGFGAATSASAHFAVSQLTLRAEPGVSRERVVLRANGRRHFYLNKGFLSLSGVTLENGSAEKGGSVFLENSDDSGLALTNCLFRGNRATVQYGVLYCASRGAQYARRPRTAYRCGFVDNASGRDAGVGQVAQVAFEECGFTNNAAASSHSAVIGGCRYVRCAFVGNRGRPLFSRGEWDAATAFDACRFERNAGTLMDVSKPGLSWTNCAFVGNRADGSLFTGSQPATMTGCDYSGNVSTNGQFLSGEITWRRCRISGNESLNGSGMRNGTFLSCLIVSNAAGGTHNNSAFAETGRFCNCTLADNVKNARRYRSLLGTQAVAVNTVFVGNRPEILKEDSHEDSFFVMSNCVWSAQTMTNDSVRAWLAKHGMTGRLMSPEAMRFDPATSELLVPRSSSPLRDSGWSDAAYGALIGDRDFRNRPRVALKGLDIGCNEVQGVPGLCIWVR